jgi:hypothetical protein
MTIIIAVRPGVNHGLKMSRTLVLLALTLLGPVGAGAQPLPAGPISAFDGRVVVGAEIAATFGAEDHSAYFNFTDYEHNALRMLRLALAAAWRPSTRLELVGEVRSEDLSTIRSYAAYVRVRPLANHALDIQAGQIPPSFGAYGRRGYQSSDNPFIGYPLAYQYLTSLRPDAVPATMADLLVMRTRGWRVSYPIGSQTPGPGVPLVSAFRWDTGVQAHWQGGMVDVTGGVTIGTLSDPQGLDNNDGKQVSGRVGMRPLPGLIVGGSAARGDFLDEAIARTLPDRLGPFAQTAFGADAEYSRDRWLVRGELVWSRWNVPLVADQTVADLSALGGWVEGRYRVHPRVMLSARLDRLGFSQVPIGQSMMMEWEAPVTRIEADAGYYIQRNLVVRLAVQHNDRTAGRVQQRTYVSGQVAYWF